MGSLRFFMLQAKRGVSFLNSRLRTQNYLATCR
jgi:hypothetical protein